MKKTIITVLSLLLVAACLLTGCKKNSKSNQFPSTTDLSDTKKAQILTDYDSFIKSSISYVEYWRNSWRDDANGINYGIEYYGTYNGTMIFLFPVEAWDGETTNVTGLEFYCYELQLLAYKNHTFYYLEHAYDYGLLTKEDIVQIHKHHMSYRPWYNDNASN